LAAFREFEDSTKSVDARTQPLRVGIGWGLWEAVERVRSHHAKRFPDVRIAAEDLRTERSGTQERRIDVAVVRRPVEAAMMLVASGEGHYVGIASPFTQTHRASGVAVIPIDEPDARLDVRIAWRKGETSRAIREFVRSARAVFPAKVHAARSGAA
jgi:DNA-binding transcriptional LysR family regulator